MRLNSLDASRYERIHYRFSSAMARTHLQGNTMGQKYFEVSAQWMAKCGYGTEAAVFPVKLVETNHIGGRGFDAFIDLDLGDGWHKGEYIAKVWCVAAARGRFVDAPAAPAAPDATEAAPVAWKVTLNPLCSGQYAVTRKIGERREFITTKVGAAPIIESFYTRAAAQAAADSANDTTNHQQRSLTMPNRHGQPSFDVTDEQRALIRKIAKRADKELFADVDQSTSDTEMDLCAVIAQGTPMRLAELLEAPLPHFGHDVGGIRRFLDRKTGQLGGCFLPRYFDSEAAKALAPEGTGA